MQLALVNGDIYMPLKNNPTIADIKTSVSPSARRAISWKSAPLTVGTISTEAGLSHLEDHHALVDLVAGCFLQDPETRQTILESANLTERLRFLCHKISEISQKNTG